MSEGKNIAINVLSNSIYGVIVLIISAISAILSPTISAVMLFFQGEGKVIPIWLWVILVVSVIISITSIILNLLTVIKRKNKPQFPAIKPEIMYDKVRTELFFQDRENISCIREVRFKVLCEKMEYIRKQFTWTGKGYNGTFIEPEFEDKYSVEWNVRVFPPQIYDVIFKEPKKKGDFVHYAVRNELTDSEEGMIPVLSHYITSPTKKLELVVTVPKGMIKQANFVEYVDAEGKATIGDKIPIEVKHIGNLDVYEYQKKNPELLHRYKIEWEFDI